MEIRMKTLMAGPNGSRHPGEKCTVSADEAEMLINGGYAVASGEDMEEKPQPEADAVEAVEAAQKPSGKKK